MNRFAPPIIRAEEAQREGDLEGAVASNGYIVRLDDDDEPWEDEEVEPKKRKRVFVSTDLFGGPSKASLEGWG